MQARRRKLGAALLTMAVAGAIATGAGASGASGVVRADARHAQATAASTTWSAVPGQVVIRRTSYGIPHILAGSFYGAGEGYAFAFAQDDICTIANDYVTVDAQRSRYFGPTAGYTQGGTRSPSRTSTPTSSFSRSTTRGSSTSSARRPRRWGPGCSCTSWRQATSTATTAT